jgi:hypothetical protein
MYYPLKNQLKVGNTLTVKKIRGANLVTGSKSLWFIRQTCSELLRNTLIKGCECPLPWSVRRHFFRDHRWRHMDMKFCRDSSTQCFFSSYRWSFIEGTNYRYCYFEQNFLYDTFNMTLKSYLYTYSAYKAVIVFDSCWANDEKRQQ